MTNVRFVFLSVIFGVVVATPAALGQASGGGAELWEKKGVVECFVDFLEIVHDPDFRGDRPRSDVLREQARRYFNVRAYRKRYNRRLEALRAQGDPRGDAPLLPQFAEESDRRFRDLVDSFTFVLQSRGFLSRKSTRDEYRAMIEKNPVLDDEPITPGKARLLVHSTAGDGRSRRDVVWLTLNATSPDPDVRGLWQWYWVERDASRDRAPGARLGLDQGSQLDERVAQRQEELGETIRRARRLRVEAERARQLRRREQDQSQKLRQEIRQWKARRKNPMGTPERVLSAALRAIEQGRFTEFLGLHAVQSGGEEAMRGRFQRLHELVRDGRLTFDARGARVPEITAADTRTAIDIDVRIAVDGPKNALTVTQRIPMIRVGDKWRIDAGAFGDVRAPDAQTKKQAAR